ncbi:uncharacterized protein F4822DRAFT_416637 [Hypoxylon trugodes]|uniref:uncharacterized protein n=1 Tax=Hypoxylon trugodes TaxID=326681 RepID=UPI0021979975|nr:uncharacterized protein F4822DRAFT_416637 [Hypoxylon trugodes]KAI1384898.1 hypothetical protein F4822DRAFT_416637 [Hypoxylon trugodes]
MVGIPKSNRCEFCRFRKTKCDEAWPTCGTCKKAGKECSGPSKRVKFVHNGRHSRQGKSVDEFSRDSTTDTSQTDEASDTSSTTSLVSLRNRTTTSGATFSKLRLYHRKSAIPNKLPGSQADILAGKIITYLKSSEGTGYSLGMFLSTLVYTPPLLERHEALFDATNLLVSTWLNLCQGTGPQEMFDLRSYSRALRSLQKVLDDPQEQTSTATLAATIYLQTAEFLFDYASGIDRISHSNGIHTIMMQRGAPKPGDNFGCQLILDSFAYLFKPILTGRIDNFFLKPDWYNAIVAFFGQWKTRTPRVVEMSKLLYESTRVADAVREFCIIRKTPAHLRDMQEVETLSMTIDELRASFHSLDESTVQPLFENNMIHEVEDPDCPLGISYRFPSSIIALHCANMSTFIVALSRAKQEINNILGIADPTLEVDCLEWSAKVWRTVQYSQMLRPLGAIAFNSSICVSYKAAGPEMRTYLLKALNQADGYRRQSAPRWTEETILSQHWNALGR